MPLDEIIERLEEMDRKGLIFSVLRKNDLRMYLIHQFVLGFWEDQVNHLTKELVTDFEDYLGTFLDLDLWQKIPQLRTITVGESISAKSDVISYERAEELVLHQRVLAVQQKEAYE